MRNAIIFFVVLVSFQMKSQVLDNSLLWKISGKDLTVSSYLFGTIHITCDATLKQKVKDAMDQTKQLYLEVDMDNPNLQNEMLAGMMMKNGETMESLATDEDFKIVDAFLLKNIGYSAKMIGTIKPFLVSAMLYPKMIDCPIQSIEEELVKISKIQNESTFGLETIEEQMHVFETIPYKNQMDELVKTAKSDLVSDKKEMDEMFAIYDLEDINAMNELTKKSENVITSKFEEVILTNRNKNWIPKIGLAAKTTSTFFGVGAAHLGGEFGVINLLRKEGYTVEAVK